MTKDGVKKKRLGRWKKIRSWWQTLWGWVLLIWGWVKKRLSCLVMVLGFFVIVYGICYMKCAADPDWWGSLWKDDKDIVSTGRGIAAAGMGIVGMGLVVIRISKQNEQLDKQEKQLDKQDEQLKRQDKQLAEQQSNTYLTKLHHGMDQLASDSNLKQLIGAKQLHLLAEAEYKAKRTDNVSDILDTYCLLLRGEGEKSSELKNQILGYITERGGIYVSQEIDLAGANLEGANLKGAHLVRANLEGANLEGAHLEGAHLEGAYLRDATLRYAALRGAHLEGAHLGGFAFVGLAIVGADLQGPSLEGPSLEGAHLQGAIISSEYKPYIAKPGVKEKELIIWMEEDGTFEWQNEKGLTHKALIEKLRASGLLSKKIIDPIIKNLNRPYKRPPS